MSQSKEPNSKLAPESLVYESRKVIISPNEKVISAVSVKWTKLSRKAPYTYSPFNSYTSFSMKGKCFFNLFICRCCESGLLLNYLRPSSPFSISTITQMCFFFHFLPCLKLAVLTKMDALSQAVGPVVALCTLLTL